MAYKVTIIGGSGFIGTRLCRQLQLQDINFEIIDLKMSNQYPGECKIADVRDIESLLETITGDIVVNLAAVHRDDVRDKSEYRRTNVIGTENIALVCTAKRIKKIVFTSTVAVYGLAKSDNNKDCQPQPTNEYGKTKLRAEEILRRWQSDSVENSLIIIRPTVIFGEGNRGNVFNLINQIAIGRFLMIGSGNNKKSMAYVGNVAAFLEACILSDIKYGIYDYIDTPDLTMNELVSYVRQIILGKSGPGIKLPYIFGIFVGYLADLVSRLTGKKLPVSSIRIKKFIATTQYKSTKENLCGFEPPFQLLEGLERTLQSEYLSPKSDHEIFYTE